MDKQGTTEPSLSLSVPSLEGGCLADPSPSDELVALTRIHGTIARYMARRRAKNGDQGSSSETLCSSSLGSSTPRALSSPDRIPSVPPSTPETIRTDLSSESDHAPELPFDLWCFVVDRWVEMAIRILLTCLLGVLVLSLFGLATPLTIGAILLPVAVISELSRQAFSMSSLFQPQTSTLEGEPILSTGTAAPL